MPGRLLSPSVWLAIRYVRSQQDYSMQLILCRYPVVAFFLFFFSLRVPLFVSLPSFGFFPFFLSFLLLLFLFVLGYFSSRPFLVFCLFVFLYRCFRSGCWSQVVVFVTMEFGCTGWLSNYCRVSGLVWQHINTPYLVYIRCILHAWQVHDRTLYCIHTPDRGYSNNTVTSATPTRASTHCCT